MEQELELLSKGHFETFISGKEEVIRNKRIENIHLTAKTRIDKKEFVGCIFSEGFIIESMGIRENLIFTNCTFTKITTQGQYHFHKIYGQRLFLRNCIFNNEMNFSNCENKEIDIYNCVSREAIRIENCLNNSIKIFANTEEEIKRINRIYCHGQDLENFIIRDVYISDHLTFTRSMPQNVFIGDGKYNNISFNNQKDLTSLKIIGIENYKHKLEITKLQADSINLTGDIFIKNANIEYIDISSFNNVKGKFKILNTHFTNEFKAPNSTLVDVIFNDVNFDNANLVLDRSYIDRAIFANIIWPKNHQVKTEKEIILGIQNDKPEIKHRIKKEVYRQLKNNCKNNSNNIDALKFYQQEMNEYWNYIQISGTESKWNKLLIRIDKNVSNFGQDYIKPIKWLFKFHVAIFVIILLFGGFNFVVTTNVDSMSADALSNGIGEFFRLLNPAHSINEYTTGWLIALDIFMRLTGGFFIYHIIKATRKFAKL